MKTNRPRSLYKASPSEKKRAERECLKQAKAMLRTPLVLHGPFDWAVRARQAEEADRMRAQVARLRTKYAEASELLPELRKRWREAVNAAYPPGFWEEYRSFRAGESASLETVIRFLEVDPWFFRTGYEKAEVIIRLTRLDLSTTQAARLRQVVLHAVDLRDRREFRAYCRLARKVDSPALRDGLAERLESEDEGVRRRARWVLEGLGALTRRRESWAEMGRRFLESDVPSVGAYGRLLLDTDQEKKIANDDTTET